MYHRSTEDGKDSERLQPNKEYRLEQDHWDGWPRVHRKTRGAKKPMRMEGRLKGMSDSRIRIPSAHLGSGPHAWPDPVTQTPNGNVEIEESKMHRLVGHGSKENSHTARAATRVTVEQGTWSEVELKYTKPR